MSLVSCTALMPTVELTLQVWHHLLMLDPTELSYAFEPVFADIKERSTVVDRFIDRSLYQVYVATLWSNVVLSPGEAGKKRTIWRGCTIWWLRNQNCARPEEDLSTVFTFISSKLASRPWWRPNQAHKDLLQYFSSMILDPDGHKKWMDEIREKL